MRAATTTIASHKTSCCRWWRLRRRVRDRRELLSAAESPGSVESVEVGASWRTRGGRVGSGRRISLRCRVAAAGAPLSLRGVTLPLRAGLRSIGVCGAMNSREAQGGAVTGSWTFSAGEGRWPRGWTVEVRRGGRTFSRPRFLQGTADPGARWPMIPRWRWTSRTFFLYSANAPGRTASCEMARLNVTVVMPCCPCHCVANRKASLSTRTPLVAGGLKPGDSNSMICLTRKGPGSAQGCLRSPAAWNPRKD
jgi:hypothetical protein